MLHRPATFITTRVRVAPGVQGVTNLVATPFERNSRLSTCAMKKNWVF
jgi:hypothetical protein